jgi:MFS family permease
LTLGGRVSKAKAFWAIYTSVAISYLGVGLVAPLIAIVLAERGANSFVVGLVGTTMFAAFTAASFPAGTMVDRAGPKPILIGGLVVYGISLLAFAFVRDVWLFFFARAIEGAGAAAISVATETMISQLSEPQERARRMSYYALSVGLGWAAGPMTGVLLFGISKGLPFYGGCVFSLAAALLAAIFIPASPSNSHKMKVSGVFSARLLSPMAAGALYGYLMSSMVTLFPLYLKAIDIEEKKMGSIVTAVIIGTLASQVPIGRAADRFGKHRTLMACSLALAVIFALMPSRVEWGLLTAAAAVLGALAGSLYPVGLSMIGGLVSPDRLGAATSLFSLAFGVGSLAGPALSGFAMNRLGDEWLFYLPAGLTAAFCLLLANTDGREETASG